MASKSASLYSLDSEVHQGCKSRLQNFCFYKIFIVLNAFSILYILVTCCPINCLKYLLHLGFFCF